MPNRTGFFSLLIITVLLLQATGSHATTYALSGSYTDAVTGKAVSFSTYQGKYLFVEGMQTTCEYCQQETTDLHQLY